MVNVHRRPAPGARAIAFHEGPLRRCRVRERFQAELVAQRHRLLVGEHLVAGPEDPHDIARIRRDQGFFVRNPRGPRYALPGEGDQNRSLFDGEKPVF